MFFFTVQLHATDNNAGEISYRQLSNQTIEGTIKTYTYVQSVDADRDTLTLSWGDGLEQRVARVNGPDTDGNGVPDDVNLGNGYKLNQYVAIHTYPEMGTYTLSMTDPNRNAGILNVSFPNSVSVPFHIQTEIELSTDWNSSPVLLNPPIDFAYTGEVFLHTPNAFDVEGDSIAYKLVTPLEGRNDPVPNYTSLIDNDDFSLNEETGLITWDSPNQEGRYTIAIEVTSYRDGELVDRMIRDMLIKVEEGGNPIPGLTSDTPYSQSEVNMVMVDETVNITVMTEDVDNTQIVQLSSNSGLYDYFDLPADFTITVDNGNSGTAVFTWQLTSEHIREQPIQLVIKTIDNLGLANYMIFRFRVQGVTANENLAPESPEIRIYPNPASAVLYLEAQEMLQGNYQIYDLKGRILQSGQVDNTKGISIELLPAGQYYFQLNDRSMRPFVKH